MSDATNASSGRATSSAGDDALPQLPVDEDSHLVRERGRVLEVVRDEDHRQPEVAQQLAQLEPHRRLRVRVERRQRLVEEQHVRLARERAGERDALLLAAGELGRPRVRERGDVEPLEQLVHARAARVRDVLAHGQVREQRVLLEDEADAPLVRLLEDLPRRVEPDLVAVRDAAALRPREPGDHPEHGGLARAGRPDERERALDLER